jgi:CheY-like chemotaxis protein
MDRRMPVMDGIEATRAIRQSPGGEAVKIVAVTASVFKEQQDEMLAAGMNGFVHKPYRFHEIYDAMTEHLGVKFEYTSTSPTGEGTSAALTVADFAALPDPLRKALLSALENLDSERIRSLIRQIGETDQELSRTLSRYADNFDYPRIIEALSQASDTATN